MVCVVKVNDGSIRLLSRLARFPGAEPILILLNNQLIVLKLKTNEPVRLIFCSNFTNDLSGCSGPKCCVPLGSIPL